MLTTATWGTFSHQKADTSHRQVVYKIGSLYSFSRSRDMWSTYIPNSLIYTRYENMKGVQNVTWGG